MALTGRIEGRKSDDGTTYLIAQGDVVLRSIPIAEAMTDAKLVATIKRNKWEEL